MPLRIELKPFERIVIGESVIVNSGTRTCFLIEGEAPVLREKETVTAQTANTPARRLYLCVQMMYLKNDASRYREPYLKSLRELREAMPAARDLVEVINQYVLKGAFYRALKEIRTLMKREEERSAA